MSATHNPHPHKASSAESEWASPEPYGGELQAPPRAAPTLGRAAWAGPQPVSRSIAGRLAALVAACLLWSGCGDKIEVKNYDPPAEPSAGNWSTFAVGDPAELAVPPPPAAGSSEAQADERELQRIVKGRDLAQERSARYWAQEPTIRPWIDAALNLVTLRNRSDPVTASRAYALVSVAMNDAAVAAWRWKYRYRRKPPSGATLLPRTKDPSYPSEHAAIAAAAARVLAYAFPERAPATFEEMASRAGRSRTVAGVSFPSDVRAGLALGRSVGDAVVKRARGDGSSREFDGQRPRGRGFWEPPPGSDAPPVQPLAGTWRPWILSGGSRLRPPPPPAFDSPELKAQARRVMDVGERLKPEQRRIAKRWEGGAGTPQVPGIWNQRALTRVDRKGLSTPRVARLFALLNMSMADAGVAAWDSKYTYWFPRPQNAIRDLGLDPSWKPLLRTPLSPAYVAGRSAFSAAAVQVLGHIFPDSAKSFRAKGAEAGAAGVYGGTQYPFADQAGLAIGRSVGQLMVERARSDGAER